MCVLSLAWRVHPRWRLVMVGNRDELHSRNAAALVRWDEPGGIIAGRDLVSGGTWAGVSDQGRFAVVTNRGGFGPPDPIRRSRGALIRDVLADDGRYARPTIADLNDFNPFNMITANGDEAAFWTNRPSPVRHALEPGVHGLSNGDLDEPWAKTTRLSAMLNDWLSGAAEDPLVLLDGLQNEDREGAPAPNEVFDASHSPIFIRNPLYGTRCGTVIAVTERGRGLIAERRFDAEGAVIGETSIAFLWPGLT